MKILLILSAIVLCISSGCQVTDGVARVAVLTKVSGLPKTFILLGDTEFQGELTVSCAVRGINIKPIAVTQSVTELQGKTRMVEYDQAGFRYALKMSVKHNYSKKCVFSGGHEVDVTMSLIDIVSNDTLLVVSQSGPTKECPPLTPVWELLAKALDEQLKK